MINSAELKVPDCNNELKWTALPKLCGKCLGIKRKRIGTENVTRNSYRDSSQELLPKVTLVDMKTEHTGGKDHSSDPVSSSTSLTLTENMSLSAGCSSRTTVSNDAVVCASMKTVTMSAAAANTTSSGRNKSQNLSCSSSVKLQNNVLDRINEAPQAAFVQPLFQNSVFQFDSQIKEADNPCSTVSSVKVTAAVDMNKDSYLHQCPLCDMVFDLKYVKSDVLVH